MGDSRSSFPTNNCRKSPLRPTVSTYVQIAQITHRAAADTPIRGDGFGKAWERRGGGHSLSSGGGEREAVGRASKPRPGSAQPKI
jgi:hypothetical protein